MNMYITRLNGANIRETAQYIQTQTSEIAHELGFREQCHLVKGERNVCRFFQRANGQGKWNCQKESRDIFHPVSLRME